MTKRKPKVARKPAAPRKNASPGARVSRPKASPAETATKQQALLVYSMLFGVTSREREPTLSDVKEIPARVREELVKDGRLKKEKRDRSTVLMLTEIGREWALQKFGTGIAPMPRAAAVLERVLLLVREHFGADIVNLSNFVAGSRVTNEDASPPTRASRTTEMMLSDGIEDRVRDAYFSLTNGASRQRVLLKDLRARVRAARPDLDQTLLAMQQQQKLILMPLDNPSEVTPADEAAALHIAGYPRHLLVFQA